MLHQDLSEKLEFIQSRLFDVGSVIATPRKSDSEKVERIKFDVEVVLILEGWIDLLDSQLTPLTNFILPSGGEAASRLHVARSVCRRAERNLVGLVRQGDLDEDTFKFINRLSDFLFAAARTMASREGKEEKIWKKNLEELKNE
jgi:ATP:cob(I)alamin adenosyltransferase